MADALPPNVGAVWGWCRSASCGVVSFHEQFYYKIVPNCQLLLTIIQTPALRGANHVGIPTGSNVLQKHRGGCKLKHATEDLKGLFRAFHDLPKGALEEPLLLHRSIS